MDVTNQHESCAHGCLMIIHGPCITMFCRIDDPFYQFLPKLTFWKVMIFFASRTMHMHKWQIILRNECTEKASNSNNDSYWFIVTNHLQSNRLSKNNPCYFVAKFGRSRAEAGTTLTYNGAPASVARIMSRHAFVAFPWYISNHLHHIVFTNSNVTSEHVWCQTMPLRSLSLDCFNDPAV